MTSATSGSNVTETAPASPRFDQLNGKRVVVVQGTVQDDYATKQDLDPVRVPNYNGALNQLKAGTADAWVSPAEIGEKMRQGAGRRQGRSWRRRSSARRRPRSPWPRATTTFREAAEQGARRGHRGRHLDQAGQDQYYPGRPVPAELQARQRQRRLPAADAPALRAAPRLADGHLAAHPLGHLSRPGSR